MSFMPENPTFADFLDDNDIICNSQPISLPSQNSETEPQNSIEIVTSKIRPSKHTGQQGEFRSIEEIDSKYRHIFPYPYFNLVQSRVIEDALYSDKSMVVCAPTGSGKTVVFEMAITQLLMDMEDRNYTEDFKIIYMAPVKALCTERLTEWYPKFTKLGLLCIEVTGDTDVEFPQLKPYSIIITTPEKWDMLTRRWRDHKGLVEVVKLFLIDEVHILNDEMRGPVLEAVVSRMKTIESSVQSAHRIEQLQRQYQGNEPFKATSSPAPRIRFVAVSATVNNPEDVAVWLGTADRPALYYKFGDECRPVKLKRVVEGYPCPEGMSIFKFDIILNYKLWPIIQKYHNGKPTLIFCNTRKSVTLTAEAISREITINFNPEQKAKLTALASSLKNKKLQALILNGVGCHHAGLLFEERTNIEHAFRNRDLPILITTTTLAMGVNLPAHLVIIKNTQQYVNGAYQEYSISTILQMVGRAGRPQFDTEATAVIMTRMADKARYQALVEGTEPLQSFLHKRLAENLNSEAALGTVTDVAQCVQWLNSTFLSVRAAKDPKRYLGLSQTAPANQISKKIEELCVIAMNGLASSGLITMDEASCIESTEAGKLMSVYYIDLETMKLIMKIEGSESLERLLWLICECHELSDMHLRVDERRCLNALNRNNASATIRYPMKGKITSRQMKLNCVIQAVLGCLPIPDPSLNQEAMKIMRIADRVCKCLVAYTIRPSSICQQSKTFSAVLNSIILAKCIAAHLWENSPYVSKQLRGIGPTFSTLLASAGKVNFMLLEESHPRDLERIMNKGPPAGNIIRKQISLLPKYQLTISAIDNDRALVQLTLVNQSYLSENMDHLTAGANHKCYIIVGDSENYLLYLNSFKDTDLIRVYDGCITYEVTRKHNHQHKILAYCISSSFVGIDAQSEYLFIDVNPIYNKHANDLHLWEDVSKQTPNIIEERRTGDRKRKSNKTVVTCSKEKIKRENTLLEKIRNLKESFGKASKELMGNLNQTTEKSHKLLNNLIRLNSGTNVNDHLEPTLSSNVTEEGTSIQQNLGASFIDVHLSTEDEFEQLEDDDQVNNILQVIEKEIIKNAKQPITSLIQQHTPTLASNLNQNNTLLHNRQGGTKRLFKKDSKSNYNFIDKLEKDIDLSEENNKVSEVGGFANTVKMQIDRYLQNTKILKSNVTDIKDFLETEIKEAVVDNFKEKLSGDEIFKEPLINCTQNDINNLSGLQSENYCTEKEPCTAHDIEVGSINISEEFKETNLNFSSKYHHNDENFNKGSGNNYQHKTNNPNFKDISNIIIPISTIIYNNANKNMKSLPLKECSLINEILNESNGTKDFRQLKFQDNFQNFYEDPFRIKTDNLNIALKPSSSLVSQCDKSKELRISNVIDSSTSIKLPQENKLSPGIHVPHNLSTIILNNNNINEIMNENQKYTDWIENYSLRATKLDVRTNRNTKQTIQIIRKLKIDFDVTKIISTKEDYTKTDEVIVEETEKPEFTDIQTVTDSCKCSDIVMDCELRVNKEDRNTVNTKKQEIPMNNQILDDNNKSAFQNLTLNQANPLESKYNNQNTEKSKNVKDIIEKYCTKIKNCRKVTPPAISQIKQVNIEAVTKPSENRLQRCYKISDIENLDINLPNMCVVDSKKLDLLKQTNQITKNVQSDVSNFFESQLNVSPAARESPEQLNVSPPAREYPEQLNMSPPARVYPDKFNTDIDVNIEILSPEGNEPFHFELELTDDKTCKINNSLLDPKTLLQCYDYNNYDWDKIIPPPIEYADDLDVSPNKLNETGAYTPCSPVHYQERDDNDVSNTDDTNKFDSLFHNIVSSGKEIETWMLPREDYTQQYDDQRNPTKSFTEMKTKSPALTVTNPRNIKLHNFKFVRKHLLKLKK